MDRDVRSCQRWEEKLGLPVYRIDKSSRSKVFAYKDEIDEWLRHRFKNKELPKSAFKTRRKIFYIGLPLAGVLIFLSFFFYKNSKLSFPVDFKIEKSSLIALDEKNKELWRYNTGIGNLVSEEEYRKFFQYKRNAIEGRWQRLPHIIIKDINHDGKTEILFSIQTQNEFGEGELFCFDYKGSLLRKFKAGRELKFGPKSYSPDYRIRGMDICDLNNHGRNEIIIIARHLYYFPTQLVILNAKGKILGEYWNSGHFNDFVFVDLNNDGRKEFVLGGVNNEYRKPCIVVFDSRIVKGSSPRVGIPNVMSLRKAQKNIIFFCQEQMLIYQKHFSVELIELIY